MSDLYLTTLPENQQHIFGLLQKTDLINEFYLAGGTGQTLQLGHRISVDFDFFSETDLTISSLIQELKEVGNVKITSEQKNTLYIFLNDIRLSFITYKYKMTDDFLITGNLKIAGIKDIAGMKLYAVCQRGSKKDFIDIFYLLKSFSLKELLTIYKIKYERLDYNYVILKSLIYFDDAEKDPMPSMTYNLDWKDVKNTII